MPNATHTSIRRVRPASEARGFTLIELLVVIGVIALLISILAPALGAARRSANQTRELGALKQLGFAHAAYAQEYGGRVIPGYLRASWSNDRAPSRTFPVWDHPDDARDETRLMGSPIRRYPWRILPYLNYALDAVVLDKRRLAEIRALPSRPDGEDGFQFAIAQNPNFGLNTAYVGGDAHRGAFYRPSLIRWGSYYVKRIDQPLFPDHLIVFASSRGDRAGSRGYDVVSGYHRIDGPWHPAEASNTVPSFQHWRAPAGRYNPSRPSADYGHVDFRFDQKAASVMFDGHVGKLTLKDAYDMRRWSNQAASADWRP